MTLVSVAAAPIRKKGRHLGVPHLARDDGPQKAHPVIEQKLNAVGRDETRVTLPNRRVTLNAEAANWRRRMSLRLADRRTPAFAEPQHGQRPARSCDACSSA